VTGSNEYNYGTLNL